MDIKSVPAVVRSTSLPSLPTTADLPNAPENTDKFDSVPGTGGPIPVAQDFAKEVDDVTAAFGLELEHKKAARQTADIIVQCLSPLLTKKAPMDEQFWLLLLRIMGKVQSQKRDNYLETDKLERLQKAISAEKGKLDDVQLARVEKSLVELDKTVGSRLKNEQESSSEEENRAISTLSAIIGSQHESSMATLREIRAG